MITGEHKRPGTTPGPTLCVMEDHDGAYRAWKEAGFRNRILFHFDAHIDFAWIASSPYALLEETSLANVFSSLQQTPYWTLSEKTEEERTHLGNYIHQAIRADIVREFIWIYPDDPDVRAQRRAVRSVLEWLARAAPAAVELSRATSSGTFEGRVYGRPFRALPYSAFAAHVPDEEVLLDIDLDFLIVQSLHAPSYPFIDVRSPSFWLSPASLCTGLETSGLRYRFVTLAYSVEEGFTPLRLKFLGAELARRLTHSLADGEEDGFEALRRLFPPPAVSDMGTAVPQLEELVERRPDDAALRFNLAMLLLERNDIPRAAAQYRKAIEADPTYRTPYDHSGPVLLDLGLTREARASCDRMKLLDPHNVHYRLFDFELLTAERDWVQAIVLGRKLLKDGVDDPALRLGLADCYLHLQRYEEAWAHLEGCPASTGGPGRQEVRLLWLKARAAEGLSRVDDALACYQRLIQLGHRTPGLHLALAKVYLRKRNLYKARRHLFKAVRLECLSRISRLWSGGSRWDSET